MRGRNNCNLIKICHIYSAYVMQCMSISCESYHSLKYQIKVSLSFVSHSMLSTQKQKNRGRKKKAFLTLSYLTIYPFQSILGIAFKLHGIQSVFDKIPHNDDGKYFCDMASSTQAGRLEQQQQPTCTLKSLSFREPCLLL